MQKYGIFAARGGGYEIVPISDGEPQVYYLASEVDARKRVHAAGAERLQARIAELEQALRDIAANCDSDVGGAPPRIWIPAAIKNLGL